MSTKAKGVVRLKLATKKKLETLLDALKPEVNVQVTRRCNASLTRDRDFLVLAVEAEDTTALRATLNAYLRWIESALKVVDLIKDA